MSTLNLAIFILVYIFLLFLMMLYYIKSSYNPRNARDDDDGDGGGWDTPNDVPEIDLPPGVYILPPDEVDPSQRKVQLEQELS